MFLMLKVVAVAAGWVVVLVVLGLGNAVSIVANWFEVYLGPTWGTCICVKPS